VGEQVADRLQTEPAQAARGSTTDAVDVGKWLGEEVGVERETRRRRPLCEPTAGEPDRERWRRHSTIMANADVP
jgi:hypothetical protein